MGKKMVHVKIKNWYQIFANHISNKELISRIHKELLNRNRVTDVGNKRMVTRGERWGEG